ncbi:MAG: anhydro-N-acetylmuramic acid kinase [Candidatus Riflebacteria bacterium]|nr:anhydro-N-acetylmuramic acid kinase [Candidatus Riflebacteria bacterium]
MLTMMPIQGDLQVLGLMSGTSGDGIDGALVRFGADGGFRLLWHDSWPFPAAVRSRLQGLMAAATAREVLQAGTWVAGLYAEAVAAFRRRHRQPVDLLAAHGQTLDHDPSDQSWDGIPVRGSLQVLDASFLAERSGLPVVYDFRRRDMAVGGQGAPLVPFGDLRFFGGACRRGLVVLNVGGIANVTVIRGGRVPRVTAAFDTGPGNMLMDALAERLTGGKQTYDAGGRLAAAGTTSPRLLATLLRDPYLAVDPPKSTGRDLYGRAREAKLWRAWGGKLATTDLMSTFLDFTVETIALAIERFVLPAGPVDETVIAGGGALNPELVCRLARRLESRCRLRTSDALGVPVMAREAMAFAALGDAFARGLPANVPVATGAARPVLLGCLAPSSPPTGTRSEGLPPSRHGGRRETPVFRLARGATSRHPRPTPKGR